MEYDRDWKHSMARLSKDNILDLFAEKMQKIDELEMALAAKTNVASQSGSSPASDVVAVVSRSATTEDAASELKQAFVDGYICAEKTITTWHKEEGLNLVAERWYNDKYERAAKK